MIKLDVLKDGIDKTMEILGQHFSHPKLESIGRSRITVQFFDMPTTIFKFSKLYYVVKDRFGSPWIIESTDAIDALVEMYDELQTKRNNEVALFAQTSRSLLDKRKDNVRLRRQLAENKKRIEELSKPKCSEVCTLCGVHMQKKVGLDAMLKRDAQQDSLPCAEEAIPSQSEAPELVISLTTSRPWEGVMHLELHSMLELPTGTLQKGCSLASFYSDKLSEYEAAQSYLDMIIYPSKWTLLGDEQYMKTKGWFLVWQVHLQDLQKLHQQGWKIDMYVNSGTKLVDPQLPPIREGSFVSNEPVEELTPAEEVAPIQTEAPDFELHTITLKVVPYYNDKLGLQVTKNVTFNETGLIDTSDFLIFDIPKDLSIDALISKINYQHGDFNKVTDLTDSERKCLRYSRIWDGISRMRQNYKALTFVLAEPDPEPSVAEQEVMQAEVAQMPKAREIVNVYVRLRIKFIHRKKVQVLELVNTIYYGVLHSGQEIVDDIPFNMDIHTVVKDLNTRNCLMPRTDPDKSIKIFPNFTSYAQEVYRNGKAVQLVIGVPTE